VRRPLGEHSEPMTLLKYGVIIFLACIPSARDACEHDYSVFQQNAGVLCSGGQGVSPGMRFLVWQRHISSCAVPEGVQQVCWRDRHTLVAVRWGCRLSKDVNCSSQDVDAQDLRIGILLAH
jgi:hypothetical protein